MAVRIIVDSGVDFPGEVDPRVTVIPLSITFGTTTYADGVDITNDRFYEMLIESDELPKTSQATPYVFQQAFEDVRAAGVEAVVVTLSSKHSGTYQSAVTAASDVPEVHVVDSKNVTIGGASARRRLPRRSRRRSTASACSRFSTLWSTCAAAAASPRAWG